MQRVLFIAPYILQVQSRTSKRPSNDKTSTLYSSSILQAEIFVYFVCLFMVLQQNHMARELDTYIKNESQIELIFSATWIDFTEIQLTVLTIMVMYFDIRLICPVMLSLTLVVNACAANCLKKSSLKSLLCVEWVLNSACSFIYC